MKQKEAIYRRNWNALFTRFLFRRVTVTKKCRICFTAPSGSFYGMKRTVYRMTRRTSLLRFRRWRKDSLNGLALLGENQFRFKIIFMVEAGRIGSSHALLEDERFSLLELFFWSSVESAFWVVNIVFVSLKKKHLEKATVNHALFMKPTEFVM